MFDARRRPTLLSNKALISSINGPVLIMYFVQLCFIFNKFISVCFERVQRGSESWLSALPSICVKATALIECYSSYFMYRSSRWSPLALNQPVWLRSTENQPVKYSKLHLKWDKSSIQYTLTEHCIRNTCAPAIP